MAIDIIPWMLRHAKVPWEVEINRGYVQVVPQKAECLVIILVIDLPRLIFDACHGARQHSPKKPWLTPDSA